MRIKNISLLFLGLVVLALLGLFLWPLLSSLGENPGNSSARAQQGCLPLSDPKEVPAPALIDFDDLPNAQVIGTHYKASRGVTFEDTRITRVLTYSDPANAPSPPNVAINDAAPGGSSNNVPMVIYFDSPKSHVGFWIGNGENQNPSATLIAYDANNTPVCEWLDIPVPEPPTKFVGFADPDGRIVRVELDYGDTALSETIDDLYFSPRPGAAPTRTPVPTWTPVPTLSPTPGPAPTATPVLPMLAYKPPKIVSYQPLPLLPDLSIHGIEIIQGIQCFNTGQGLAGCSDNSLPMVAQKDSTARIYLKFSGLTGSSMSNVPVRLYIWANGTWYNALVSGKATTSVDQATNDSANVYFNVNFPNGIQNVSFYAVVDPDGLIAETNESNNRFPAAANTYITLNFQKRDPLKIVGQRLRYHPSGYTGAQYAGGWAVNGGAADWFEQLLPIRNNGVNYSVKSGYLDWTQSLSPCSSSLGSDNQHLLIQTLNVQWILQNALSWLFGSGAFTGADHVYGWVPDAGYPCGHADMPVYPHAGGLGVVGIGTDAPGTSTDNPGAGALIFGHELVHDYDLKHTNTADACGSNDGSSDFPYSSSSIQEFGLNPYTGKIYNPNNTHDLMSYCPSGGSRLGWISPFTWTRMFNKLAPGTAMADLRSPAETAPGVFALTNSKESLVVNATLFNPKYEPSSLGELDELYRIEGGLTFSVTVGNEYAVELLNLLDEKLASYSFNVNFESEYDAHLGTPGTTTDSPPFSPEPTTQQGVSFIIPWEDGTASVALLYQGNQIDIRKVSNHPPKVTITDPSASATWPAGSTQTLVWFGSDADGDSLKYTLMYSHDGGANWVLIANDLTETKYDIQVDAMAGGNDARFRVVATDGINIGYDETDGPIVMPNHPPLVTILNPSDKHVYLPGELVVLQGYGTDMEDGSLPDGALLWVSDVEGALGIGPSVPVVSLSKGWHTISLIGTDSFGILTEVQVYIFVGYQTFLPNLNR
ncbi:MAG: hypothetical protein JSV61_05060 [Anaerolineales bacterium]|nr:MAG: hypothetical protein JSV61_05060 [Anaerolineales bacterium]